MIYVDKSRNMPLYRQLYVNITGEILSGAMPAGYRLPATRKLAAELSIGRNTVEKAYQQLEAEGYIIARAGSGFTVAEIPLDFSTSCKVPPEDHMTASGSPASVTVESEGAVKNEKDGIRYDFVYGSMANDVFPYKQWRRCMNDVLTRMELEPALHYPPRMGQPELQQAVAAYLRRSRNVSCRPEDILITPGQQHSMEILANLVSDGRRAFAMEEPGYDGIRRVFEVNGFGIVPVKVGGDGIIMDELENVSADFLYLTPSHQFPTGSVTPVGRRRQLINWAGETGTYIIEDDYDSELRYYTSPIPAMQSLDAGGSTIYTGTFSKSLAPVMRTAYMILPEKLREKYRQRYGRYNSMVSTFHQLTLARFISEGYYEQHINRLRTIYRRKHAALLKAMDDVFGERIRVLGEGAGIHLMIDVDSPLPQCELADRAAKIGIRLYTTEILYADRSGCPQHRLMLGFPIVPTDAFEDIMRDLRKVWEME